MSSKKIIVALDSNDIKKIKKTVNELKSEAYAFKIGYEFFFNHGLDGYKTIKNISPNIFLDLKLHDIPNTVRKGIKAISKLNPLMTTIHISGGDEMMKASMVDRKKTKILGVSVLTSLDKRQIKKYYNNSDMNSLVKKFVKQANKLKLDGIVCSPKEIKYIRNLVSKEFLIVTPGIRLNKIKNINDDQKRVLTPSEAIKLGANYLVIGRPILKSKNPLRKLKEINKSLD